MLALTGRRQARSRAPAREPAPSDSHARRNERDVVDQLALYGAGDGEVMTGLLVLVSQARTRDWRPISATCCPPGPGSWLGMEASAAVIRRLTCSSPAACSRLGDDARVVAVLGRRGARAGRSSAAWRSG